MFYNNNIDYEIEKIISILGSNANSLNWVNIENDFKFLALKYKYLIKREKRIIDNSPIWIMWYQGIKFAPPIVKSCIKSVIINKGKHHLHIIDKNNLKKYLELPSYIIEKFNNKSFSITHLSDIVRIGLLYKYGGYWIDSTILLTTPLKTFNSSFFTLKKRKCGKHPFINCKWVVFIMGSRKKSFISTYVYISFLIYLKKYNSFIDYFLLDYIISIAYKYVDEFKNMIDKLPYDSCNMNLFSYLNLGYEKSYFRCQFNKLSYKKHFNLLNGKNKSNYGYIIEKYKL